MPGQLADGTISFNATTAACEKSSQWQSALTLILRLQELKLQVTVTAENALINACGSQQRWKYALHALGRMQDSFLQPNLTTFNNVLNVREKGRMWRYVTQLVHQMMKLKLVPGMLTHCAATAAAGRSAKWQLGLFFLPRSADLVAYSSAMEACLTAKRCKPVLVLLHELHATRLESDTVVCSSVMAACVIARQPKQAAAVLHEVQRHGMLSLASLRAT